MSTTYRIGTIEYAMAKALEWLGAERMCEITGKSESAIRKGLNQNDPLDFSWLTRDHVIELAAALLAQDRPEFFSVDIQRSAEEMVEEITISSETVEVVLADAHYALAQVSKAVAKARHPESEEGADMSVNELEETLIELEKASSSVRRAKNVISQEGIKDDNNA